MSVVCENLHVQGGKGSICPVCVAAYLNETFPIYSSVMVGGKKILKPK